MAIKLLPKSAESGTQLARTEVGVVPHNVQQAAHPEAPVLPDSVGLPGR